jgi:hypothetical protein
MTWKRKLKKRQKTPEAVAADHISLKSKGKERRAIVPPFFVGLFYPLGVS